MYEKSKPVQLEDNSVLMERLRLSTREVPPSRVCSVGIFRDGTRLAERVTR